jgi:hypothetical protein
MGLFSFIGGLLGGGSEKKAVKKATQAQVDALNRGIDEQHRQFDLTRSDFSPYLSAGVGAIGGLGDLMGLNGNDKASAAIKALKASPTYQSLYNNGLEAVLQNASATGGIRGGNTERGLAGFGADTLSSVITDQLSRLGGLAGLGEGATDAVSGFGQHTADAISSLFGQQGAARASGALAIGGINNQMWNSAGSFLDQAASAFMPGGGGFASIFKGF